MALKTPTAVADFIVNHMAVIENRLDGNAGRKSGIITRNIIEKNRSTDWNLRRKVAPTFKGTAIRN